MLIVMRHGAPPEDVDRVVATIEDMGYQARPMPGKQRTTVGLVGNDGRVDSSRLEALPGVQEIIHVTKPYKQVSREWKPESTVVRLPGGLTIGGEDVIVMAGPCSVESERQILDAARTVRDADDGVRGEGEGEQRQSLARIARERIRGEHEETHRERDLQADAGARLVQRRQADVCTRRERDEQRPDLRQPQLRHQPFGRRDGNCRSPQ